MKLYYSPGACSLAPHIVAEEAGIPLEYERVNIQTHRTEKDEDFFNINPKGYVPALRLDDGAVLTEAPAVLQYLSDQKPASHLAPDSGTLARYRLMEWLGYINSELHANFEPLFNTAMPDEVKTLAKAKLALRFHYADAQLAGKPFLLGSDFTAADAYLFVMLTWARHLKIDLSPYPNLRVYFAKISQRPAVQSAMRAEGLVK